MEKIFEPKKKRKYKINTQELQKAHYSFGQDSK